MTDANGSGTALKVVCGTLSGIVVTVLFMWVTFPRDLATNQNITVVATAFQKNVDSLEAQQRADETEYRAAMSYEGVEIGKIEERLKMQK